MTLVYLSRSGALFRDGDFLSYGYSGNGHGKDNPEMDHVANVGPIPRGRYLVGKLINNDRWRDAIPLTRTDRDPNGRSGFMLHGDNMRGNYSASRGCIVLPPGVRKAIAKAGDDTLIVVPG